MNRLRVGVIGCGRIFPKHEQSWKRLGHEAELVSVCDQVPARLEKAAALTGAKPYLSFLDMIQKERLDVVSVLTPSGSHAEVAMACAPFVPNLIVEKPMALRIEDADSLIRECERLGRRLFVVKQNRYNPPVRATRTALEEGRFGRLIMGTVRVRWCRTSEYYRQDAWRGTWDQDGGVLTNQASHHIDLLTWMMGPVDSVFAKDGTYLAPVETEDTGVALLKFKSGALGVIEATTCTRPRDLEGSISLLGEKGSVEIAGFAVNQMRHWGFSEPRPEDARFALEGNSPPDVYGFGHLAFMEDVVRCIREGRQAMIDGLEGRKSLDLIHAIYESIETGREVRLDGKVRSSRLGVSQK